MGRRGLVFGGGGARGAYEIGVWRAIKELNIHVDIVVGTSIGALNGALFAQHDYVLAQNIWNHMSPDLVMKDGMNLDYDIDLLMSQRHQFELFIKQFIQRRSVDISPLRSLIQYCVKENVLRTSDIRFGLCTLEVPKNIPRLFTIDEIPEGKVGDFLLASASCFPVFPICEIDGKHYIDGGYYDNVPIQLAKRMGADEYIVVDLTSRPKLDYKHRLYKNVTFISPYYELSSFLNFDGEIARKTLQLGYLDAMKQFHQYIGFAYTFETKGVSVDNRYIHTFLITQKRMQRLFEKHPRFRSFFYRFNQKRIKNAIVLNDEMEDFALALRFCEVAGEVMDLDRYVIHDFHNFNDELWRRFQRHQEKYIDVPFVWREIRSILKVIDPIKLTIFLYRQLIELMTSSKPLDEYSYMMSLQGDEIIAAVYLFALHESGKYQEKNSVISVNNSENK